MADWIGAHLHDQAASLDRAAKLVPDEAAVEARAKILKLFSGPTRLRLLAAVRLADEICQTVVSYHLAQLPRAGILTSQREYKLAKYSLTPEGAAIFNRILPASEQ